MSKASREGMSSALSNAQYTPPTPTGCVLNLQLVGNSLDES